MSKEEYFAPENEDASSRRSKLSPSGRHKLIISNFETKPGSWSYSQGVVLRRGRHNDGIVVVDEDGEWQPVATVQRNYGVFPFLFVEDHPKGDFLVCGHDYQGQTVVDLGTGARKDVLSPGTEDGHGFCWAEYRFEEKEQVLVVSGCHWACPYEYRLYDFSSPMNGWPEIALKGDDDPGLGGIGIYDDIRWPAFEPDGSIMFYQSEDDEDPEIPGDRRVASHKSFRREGDKLVFLHEWVSDREKQRRADRKKAEEAFEAWKEEFKKSDPLYLAYARLVSDPALSPEEYMGLGVVHDSWCPDYKSEGEKERRWCRRIVTKPGKTGLEVGLEWAVDQGPVKLVVHKNGDHAGDEFFEHSAAGMEAAFARAMVLVGESL